MSLASRSKSKDKQAVKEEAPKVSSKSSSLGSASSGTLASGIEYDSASNNGSLSAESEEHKEKTSETIPRPESVPGAHSDKRDKIRQNNERKHQRQKERRAQELHEKCSGYLMSRKLEALAHQLVAMGFSHERATMALILNEGKVEESVSWLIESSEDDKKREHIIDGGGNLKIDISEELGRIAELETKYKASKQEVERAIVASEGDIDKAEEALKEHKQEPPAVLSKPDYTGEPPIVETGAKLPIPVALNLNAVEVNLKSSTPTIMQQRRDDRDFNYTKAPVTVASSPMEPGTKILQQLKKVPPKPPTDKRTGTGSTPSVSSYSLTSRLQASPHPANPETCFIGNELKNLQLGSVRGSVLMMQQPQSINGRQVPSSSVGPSPPNWYSSSNVETVKPNGLVPPVSVSRSSQNGVSLNPMYNQLHYQTQQLMPSNSSMDSQGVNNGMWSREGASPTIMPTTNLGLFSGIGANGLSGSNSPADWSTGGSMMDYTAIDWSLDPWSLTSNVNGWWANGSYFKQDNAHTVDAFSYGLAGSNSAMRPMLANQNARSFPGLQDNMAASHTSVASLREWSSPFEENDIFSLPR